MKKMKFYTSIILLILIFFMISTLNVAAVQDSIPQLSSGDKKKIEEANSLKKNTDKTMDEVNKLEEEILKTNVANNDKSGQKKLDKLQNNALRKHIDALDNYGSVHETYFNVYGGYITKFWNHFSGDKSSLSDGKNLEEQAKADFSKAKKLRKETEGYEYGKLVLDKLMEADSLEKSALTNQNTALKIYTLWPQKYIPPTRPTENTNIAKVDTAQKAAPVVAETPVEPTTPVTPAPVTPTTAENYVVENNVIEKTDNNVSVNQPEIPNENIAKKEEQQVLPQDTAKNVQQTVPIAASIPNTEVTPATKPIPAVPINIAENNTVEEVKKSNIAIEQGNNIVINGNNFGKFLEFLNETPSDLQGKASNFEAFQQAWKTYLSDNTAMNAISKKKQIGKVKKSTSPIKIKTSGLVFRLQIAASHQPLSAEKMKHLTKGNSNYDIIPETNWNKCFLGNFKSYEEANIYKKNSAIQGAFIVAFYEGRQIEVAQAIKISR